MRTGVAWFPDVPVAVIAITHVYAQALSDVPMISQSPTLLRQVFS